MVHSVRSVNHSEKSINYSAQSARPSLKSNETGTTIITNSGDWKTPLARESFVTLNPWRLFLTFRNARLLTIEPVLFLYMYGTFLFFPVFQQYVFWRIGTIELLSNSTLNFTVPNGSFCLDSTLLEHYGGKNLSDRVQTLSNHLSLLTSFANRFPSVIVTLFILGPLSDRFGRKPAIYITAAGALLQVALTILFIYYKANPLLFLVSQFCAGITGDFAAILTSCLSYVADVGSLKWRTVRIAIAESMVFLAGAVAQGTGGLWLDRVNCDFITPLWLVLACHAGIILYTLVYLPEALSPSERLEHRKKGSRGIAVILKGFKLMLCGWQRYSVWKLWIALLALVIYVANVTGSQMLTVFFFKAPEFNWNATLIGAYQSTAMTSHGLCLLVLVPILVLLRFPDPLIALVGLAFSGGMNLFFGFANKTYEFFISELAVDSSVCIPNTIHCCFVYVQ